MNKEKYDKYKKVVAELDGYDICDEFNLGTYELKDKKKLVEIVLMYYFKNQDELEEKDKEIERLNNIINELESYIKHYDKIEGYYEYVECGYDEYNSDEDVKEQILDYIKELKEGK